MQRPCGKNELLPVEEQWEVSVAGGARARARVRGDDWTEEGRPSAIIWILVCTLGQVGPREGSEQQIDMFN